MSEDKTPGNGLYLPKKLGLVHLILIIGFIVGVASRALVAEYRLGQLESAVRTQAIRDRKLEKSVCVICSELRSRKECPICDL